MNEKEKKRGRKGGSTPSVQEDEVGGDVAVGDRIDDSVVQTREIPNNIIIYTSLRGNTS